MSHWGFWDWIAYICVGISALGLAIGAVFKENPAMLSSFPRFFGSRIWRYVPIILFTLGTVVLAIKTAVPLFAGNETKIGLEQTTVMPVAASIPTRAKIQFNYGNSDPDTVEKTNIWRVYALAARFVGRSGGKTDFSRATMDAVFVI